MRNSGSGSKSSSSQKNLMNKTQKINSNVISGGVTQAKLAIQVNKEEIVNENVLVINSRQNQQMLTSRNSSSKNLYKTNNEGGGSKNGNTTASFSNTP
jgi:hypothetical protein